MYVSILGYVKSSINKVVNANRRDIQLLRNSYIHDRDSIFQHKIYSKSVRVFLFFLPRSKWSRMLKLMTNNLFPRLFRVFIKSKNNVEVVMYKEKKSFNTWYEFMDILISPSRLRIINLMNWWHLHAHSFLITVAFLWTQTDSIGFANFVDFICEKCNLKVF